MGPWVRSMLIQVPLPVEDPKPPVRLEGNAGVDWRIPGGEYTRRLRALPRDGRLYVHALLGSGKSRAFAVDIVDPEALAARQLLSPEEYTKHSDQLWGKDLLDLTRAIGTVMPGQEVRGVFRDGDNLRTFGPPPDWVDQPSSTEPPKPSRPRRPQPGSRARRRKKRR
jgi:hypothetical protein